MSALASAGQSFGLVVIAGTGARVAMRTRTGRETSLDTLGPVLGDSGSGYYINAGQYYIEISVDDRSDAALTDLERFVRATMSR